MARYVALLRAINLGATRTVPMARLRELLEADGFDDVATYVQSGNVVLSTTGGAADDPRRYQVTFLDRQVPTSSWAAVDPDAWGESTYVATPTELSTYTPGGIHADRMLA